MPAHAHPLRVRDLANQKRRLRARDLGAIKAPQIVLTRHYPLVRMVQMTSDVYTTGVEEHMCDGVKLRVYGAAKTVVDCFKHRNKIGRDVALDALKDARAKRKASADDLWRYAMVCCGTTVMRPYLEAVE